ncbi:hypothetical protein SAMN05444157_0905 [Frankineae bacterium MT45]|nr:hypothetical protein SAMN05444157_0905 [Frankineae bacterium MT45]
MSDLSVSDEAAPSAEEETPQPAEQADGPQESRYTWATLARDTAWCAAAAIVSLVIAIQTYRIRPWNIRTIWSAGDMTVYYSEAKGMIDHGWWTPNTSLGYPFLQDSAHFPQPDITHLIAYKFLTMLTGNPIVTVNAYFLMSYAMIPIATCIFFRVAGMRPAPASILSFAFTAVPWHGLHLAQPFLGDYFPVPLGLMVMLIVVRGWCDKPWSAPGQKLRFSLTAIAAIIVALSGVYYAVFSAVLIFTAVVVQIAMGRRFRGSFKSYILAAIIPVVFAFTLLAIKLSAVTASIGNGAVQRLPTESQLFGGSLFTLVRPSGAAGIALHTGLANTTFGQLPAVAGQDSPNSTLGAIAIVVTTLFLFFRWINGPRTRRLAPYVASLGFWPAVFVICVGFYVTSGLGSIFASLVSPNIRAWERICVFVFCVAFLCLGLLVTALMDRHSDRREGRRRWIGPAVCALMLLVAFVDAALSPLTINYKSAVQFQVEMRNYVRAAEAVLPKDCPVLEMPLVPYPEAGPINHMDDYTHMWPYIFSTSLRFSYGGLKDTAEGDWYQSLSPNLATQVKQARAAGFCAVHVDQAAYTTRTVQTTYRSLLGAPVARSSTGRWMMFSLANVDPAPFDTYSVLHPTTSSPGEGFSSVESSESGSHVWAIESHARLYLVNTANHPSSVTVTFQVSNTPCNLTSELTVTRSDTKQSATTDLRTTHEVTSDVVVPASGTENISFAASGLRCVLAPDIRTLWFRVAGISVAQVPSGIPTTDGVHIN